MTALPSPFRSSLHAHSAFDDGSLTPEGMVEAALERGFEVMGISGHAWMGRPEAWCMTEDGTKDFVREMGRLKTKYFGRISVYCGLERDVLAPPPAGPLTTSSAPATRCLRGTRLSTRTPPPSTCWRAWSAISAGTCTPISGPITRRARKSAGLLSATLWPI